jgi:hypothetical protein
MRAAEVRRRLIFERARTPRVDLFERHEPNGAFGHRGRVNGAVRRYVGK